MSPVPFLIPLLLAFTTQPPQEAPLARVAWMSGCWELRRGDRVVLEQWMPATGDLMLGASRTQVAGVTRDFEHLRLSARDGVLVYTALPARQAETSFTSIEIGDGAVTFENLEHDFPQRIIYRRLGADSLVARIEGPGPQGTRGVDFPMARVACGAEGD